MPALSGCGLLGSSGSGGAPGPNATTAAPRSYTIASRVAAVIINGGAGKITVTGSSRTTIAVTEQPYHSNSAKPPATRHGVSTTAYGATLTLSYSCPSQLTCGVGYEVAVPRGMTVRVSNREGAVALAGLAGPVSASTVAGVIIATALASRAAELTSRAGAITATFTAVPDSVTATTNAGPITLTLPESAAYKVDAHTYVGQATVSVRQSAAAKTMITASSDLGSITIKQA
jgi:hypothetical protein